MIRFFKQEPGEAIADVLARYWLFAEKNNGKGWLNGFAYIDGDTDIIRQVKKFWELAGQSESQEVNRYLEDRERRIEKARGGI